MWSPRMGSLSRPRPSVRRLAAWCALALGWLLPSTGCQVEYAGMTLPSGKYMHDDVQYFAPGPEFPWANTQAAAQRARMQAMGIDLAPPNQTAPWTPPVAAGAPAAVQNVPGRATNVNDSPLTETAPVPAPGAVGAPAGGPAANVPTPPAPGGALPPPPGGAAPAPAPAPGGAVPPPGGAAPAPAPAPAPGGAVPPPPPGGAAPPPGL
jgi:hypothetical protein